MSLNKIAIIVGILIILIIGVWGFLNLQPVLGQLFNGPSGKVTIKETTFKVIVADTVEKQKIGLSKKQSLPKDQGMLFVFGSPQPLSFWMKDMKFPIDIIFITNNKITTIYENVPAPESATTPLPLYKPTQPADTVLEINAGQVKEFGIKLGDSVQVELNK